MNLRDYQKKSITMLYEWFEKNKGNPCIVMPTGSGKSHVIAALVKNVLQEWPETRVLMLTHVRELIEQNAQKMRQHWPGAPMGIYSAGIGRKELDEPITFAGIQSIRNRAKELGHVDLVIIDECHLVNHNDEGGYRRFISELIKINPTLRVIGFTATPYRLGHGMITDKPAIFDAILEPISIEELIDNGYLSPLRSKITNLKLNTDGVHKRGGEFIESELQRVVDTNDNNDRIAKEIIAIAGDRRAWLLFCSGVKHAERMAAVLNDYCIRAECVTGDTPKAQRNQILSDFKAGKIKALTNANVLTTGFDYPDIDLIAMLRPTMSPGLYVQMAGRGMRIKSHTDHCLVLDFAGVVATHGPITAVRPPDKKEEGSGDAPVKVCDVCFELCTISARKCPACGEPFPEPPKKELQLRADDIMGINGVEMQVSSWKWKPHISRSSGKNMIACTYYGALSDHPVTEYFPIFHEGYAGQSSRKKLVLISKSSNGDVSENYFKNDIEEIIKTTGEHESLIIKWIVDDMESSTPPKKIEYKQDGKFFKIISRSWNEN